MKLLSTVILTLAIASFTISNVVDSHSIFLLFDHHYWIELRISAFMPWQLDAVLQLFVVLSGFLSKVVCWAGHLFWFRSRLGWPCLLDANLYTVCWLTLTDNRVQRLLAICTCSCNFKGFLGLMTCINNNTAKKVLLSAISHQHGQLTLHSLDDHFGSIVLDMLIYIW